MASFGSANTSRTAARARLVLTAMAVPAAWAKAAGTVAGPVTVSEPNSTLPTTAMPIALPMRWAVATTPLAAPASDQLTVKMSLKKIVQALRRLQQVTVNIAGHDHTASDPLTGTPTKIIAATGDEWPTH